MRRTKTAPILGLVCGIITVVLSIVMFASGSSGDGGKLSDMDTGTYTSYSYYGGDAYTGIQQAAADTARNVKSQSAIIKAGFQKITGNTPGFAALLLCVGLGMICYFLRCLNEINARNAFEAAVIDKLDILNRDCADAEKKAEADRQQVINLMNPPSEDPKAE